MTQFAHLHLHSQYSLLDGANRIDDVIAGAVEKGMPAIALTDHGNMFGAIEFYDKARAAGIKPIIGIEAYVAQGSMRDRDPQRGRSNHLVLLAKNETGYRNLLRLTTKSYLEGFYYKPRIDKELLRQSSEGLIALSACLNGEVSEQILAGAEDQANAVCTRVPRHLRRGQLLPRAAGPRHPRAARHQRGGAPPGGAQRRAAGGHQRLPLPQARGLVRARRPALHRHPEDARRSRPAALPRPAVLPEERRRDARGAAAATAPRSRTRVRIAEACNLEIPTGSFHLPEFPVPGGYTLDSYLTKVAREGLEVRLDKLRRSPNAFERHSPEVYARRLETELEVIVRMGFAGYFLIVWDFVRYAREQSIPVGPGPRLGGRLAGVLRAGDHRHRPAALRAAVRALPQPRPHLDAGHRHRLLHAAPRRSHPVREREVRPRPGGADHHLRDAGRQGGAARRRPRARRALRQDRPHRQAGPRHDQVAVGGGARDRGAQAGGGARRRGGEDRRGRQPARRADAPRVAARRRRRHRAARDRGAGPALQDVQGRDRHPVGQGRGREPRAAQDGLPGAAHAHRHRRHPEDAGAPRHAARPRRGAARRSRRLSAVLRGTHQRHLPVRVARHEGPAAPRQAVEVRGPRGLQRALPPRRALGRHGRGVHPAQERAASASATSSPPSSRSCPRPTASSPTRNR